MLSCWKHKKKTNSAALVKKGERESKRHAKGRVKRLGGKGEMLRIYPGVALSSNSSSIKETRMSDQDWDLGGNLVRDHILRNFIFVWFSIEVSLSWTLVPIIRSFFPMKIKVGWRHTLAIVWAARNIKEINLLSTWVRLKLILYE